MLRFYTPADRRRSFLDLYRIKSVEDYIESISKLNIDVPSLNKQNNIHPDYEFIEGYLSKLIDKSARICFLGVFDLVKEAYFINKYPHKTFLIGDVSKNALSCLEQHYPNLQIRETTLDDFEAQPDDLVIINIAEYFLSQQQLSGFVSKGGIVILNNVHFYIPGSRWFLYSIVQEVRVFCLNMYALATGRRQWQFRGWWRTMDNFISAACNSKKYVKTIVFNRQRTRDTKFGRVYSAMVHFDSES